MFNAELSAQFDAAVAVSEEIDPTQKYRPGMLGALRRAVVAWVVVRVSAGRRSDRSLLMSAPRTLRCR